MKKKKKETNIYIYINTVYNVYSIAVSLFVASYIVKSFNLVDAPVSQVTKRQLNSETRGNQTLTKPSELLCATHKCRTYLLELTFSIIDLSTEKAESLW
jgi:hypothetical protein